MKLLTIAVLAVAFALAGCGTTGGSDTKNITSLIKTLQDDKACDRVRDIDIGGGAGQLGGEGHVSFKEHSECGVGHGTRAMTTAPTPQPAPAPAPPT